MKTKLVRDKIPLIMKKSGKTPIIRISNKSNFRKFLIEKLIEESIELKKNFNKEEIADILEVVYSLIKNSKYTLKSIERIRKEKNKRRGSFGKRIILVDVK